jgi:hypothetical protein
LFDFYSSKYLINAQDISEIVPGVPSKGSLKLSGVNEN